MFQNDLEFQRKLGEFLIFVSGRDAAYTTVCDRRRQYRDMLDDPYFKRRPKSLERIDTLYVLFDNLKAMMDDSEM
jgi:hypothetical protein